jgi:hypothetical protein
MIAGSAEHHFPPENKGSIISRALDSTSIFRDYVLPSLYAAHCNMESYPVPDDTSEKAL